MSLNQIVFFFRAQLNERAWDSDIRNTGELLFITSCSDIRTDIRYIVGALLITLSAFNIMFHKIKSKSISNKTTSN